MKSRTNDLPLEEPKKKPKRKPKRNRADAAYNPKRDNKRRKKESDENSHLGKASMRSNVQKTLKSETDENEEVPVKTSFHIKPVKPFDSPNFRSTFQKSILGDLTNIPSYRPITFSDKDDSPDKGFTPEGKTPLFRTGAIGPMCLFSNTATSTNAKPISRKLDSTFKTVECDEFQKIKESTTTEKTQAITITPELLKKTIKEIQDLNGRSQNAVMVKEGVNAKHGSATQYAKATTLFEENLNWEWLHLIAFSLAGEGTQDENNLVCGTYHANTEMMAVEQEMKFLAKSYPHGFKLQIKANLIENTHIATEIEYNIITDDFTLPFTFNAQQTNQPHISLQSYMHHFIRALVETCKQRKLAAEGGVSVESKPDDDNPPHSIFYQKR